MPNRPTGVRHIVMTFLGFLAFLTYFDRICIAEATQYIEKDLNLTSSEMGLIMGAFWFSYAIFELPAGWMGDKYGPRVTLTRIVLGWSFFTALSGVARGFWSLITCRFLFGAGEAGAFPNMARIQSQWLPIASRPRAGGLLWMLARWGGAFSYPIFGLLMVAFSSALFCDTVRQIPGLGFLADQASWRLSFWAAGLVGVVWCICFYAWFRDHPSEKASVNAAELELITRGAPPAEQGHGMPSHLWGRLLTNRSLIALGILYLCGSFGWSFFASWMPKYLKEIEAAQVASTAAANPAADPAANPAAATSPSSASVETASEPETKTDQANTPDTQAAPPTSPTVNVNWKGALPLFFGGISCLIGGALCNWLVAKYGKDNKWTRAIFPMSGYVTAALAMAFIPFVKTPTQAIVLLCLAEVAHDFGQGANWATIVDIGGRYAGVAAGLINTIGNMGNAFQPYIGAQIKDNFGWSTLFGVYSCAFLMAAAMWIFIDPRRTFYGENNVTPTEN
ncbi:MAG: MFS transporter [Planctomycetota bacterium]